MTHEIRSEFYLSQSIRLHYWDHGGEGKPWLVFVHGGMDHARSWDKVTGPFLKDYHVIAVDLRGHGDSAWVPGAAYGVMEHVRDMAALSESLAAPEIDIIAHSLGGMISLCFAAAFPERVRRAVILEGLGHPGWYTRNAGLPERLRSWIEATQGRAARSRDYRTLEAAVRRMKEANAHLSDEMAYHLAIHGVQRTPDGGFTWKFDPLIRATDRLRFERADLEQVLREVECPVLLVNGEQSWAESYAAAGVQDLLRRGTVLRVPQAGHWIQHDQPEILIEAASRFLRG
jgi:pimeloyl-ACP methyl ester carboxylesterase